MFPFSRSRWFSGLLALILFFTHVVFPDLARANIWDERDQNLQLASLPANFNPAFSVPSKTSSVTKSMSSAQKIVSDRRIKKWGDLQGSSAIKNLLANLPGSFGSIRDIRLPVTKENKNLPLVLYIQDVHMNEEAQQNIGAAVKAVVEKSDAKLVALEGAFDSIPLGEYKRISKLDPNYQVANYLFRAHLMAGPVYSLLTQTHLVPRLVGIDDKNHYEANKAAVREGYPSKEQGLEVLARARMALDNQKQATFNPALRKFDQLVTAHRRGDMDWSAYVNQLVQNESNVPLIVEAFLEAASMEANLNFNRVQHERTLLLNDLMKVVSTEESDTLVALTTAFRMGEISHADLYDTLTKFCKRHDLPLNRYPAFNGYIQYILLSESIDIARLQKSIEIIENSVFNRLAPTTIEKDLVKKSQKIHFAQKLLEFSLSPKEWDAYNALGAQSVFQESGFDASSFEAFYQEAKIRDQKMAANLIRAIRNENSPLTVLVTGGFHADGVKNVLIKNGIGVLSWVPKLSKADETAGSKYLSVFAQEKTPLETLLSGEKLFLALPPVVPLGTYKELELANYRDRNHSFDGIEKDEVTGEIKSIDINAVRMGLVNTPENAERFFGALSSKNPLKWAHSAFPNITLGWFAAFTEVTHFFQLGKLGWNFTRAHRNITFLHWLARIGGLGIIWAAAIGFPVFFWLNITNPATGPIQTAIYSSVLVALFFAGHVVGHGVVNTSFVWTSNGLGVLKTISDRIGWQRGVRQFGRYQKLFLEFMLTLEKDKPLGLGQKIRNGWFNKSLEDLELPESVSPTDVYEKIRKIEIVGRETRKVGGLLFLTLHDLENASLTSDQIEAVIRVLEEKVWIPRRRTMADLGELKARLLKLADVQLRAVSQRLEEIVTDTVELGKAELKMLELEIQAARENRNMSIGLLDENLDGAKAWNEIIGPLRAQGWFGDIPVLWALFYFNRRISDALAVFSGTKYSFAYYPDAMTPFKRKALNNALPPFALHVRRIEAFKKAPKAVEHKIVLSEILKGLMSSSLVDFSPLLTDGDGAEKFAPQELANMIITQKIEQFDIVLNSAGPEMLHVVYLADYLLSEGLVEKVNFHLPLYPSLLLTATEKDLRETLMRLRAYSDPLVRDLGVRLLGRQGIDLFTHMSEFWVSGRTVQEMPERLNDIFADSDFTLFLGELNYARLTGDLSWPNYPASTFGEQVSHFPAPVASIRLVPYHDPSANGSIRTHGVLLLANNQKLLDEKDYSPLIHNAEKIMDEAGISFGHLHFVDEFPEGIFSQDLTPGHMRDPLVRWGRKGNIYIKKELLSHLPEGDEAAIQRLIESILHARTVYQKWLRHPEKVMQDDFRTFYRDTVRKINGPVPQMISAYKEMFEPKEKTTVEVYLERAAKNLHLTASKTRKLLEPDRVVRMEIPVQLESGGTKVIVAWRVQHDNRRGPYKGGVRYLKSGSFEMARELSSEMMVKTALLDIPFGGGKAVVRVDYDALTPLEQARMDRGLIREAYKQGAIGPDVDSWAPDVRTGQDPRIIDRWLDEYIRQRVLDHQIIHPELSNLVAQPLEEQETKILDLYMDLFKKGQVNGSALAAVTGKSPESGGIPGRVAATGWGVYYVIDRVKAAVGFDSFVNVPFAIQGFGKVGYHTADAMISDGGALLNAVGEWNSVAENKNGLNHRALLDHLIKNRTLDGFKEENAATVAPENPLKQSFGALINPDAVVVIPAALNGALNDSNVDEFIETAKKVRILGEGANGPLTMDAERKLIENRPDIAVVPDILSNAGGVVISAVEWLYNYDQVIRKSEEQKWRVTRTGHVFLNRGLKLVRRIFGSEDPNAIPSKIEEDVLADLKNHMVPAVDDVVRMAQQIQADEKTAHLPLREAAYRIVVKRLQGEEVDQSGPIQNLSPPNLMWSTITGIFISGGVWSASMVAPISISLFYSFVGLGLIFGFLIPIQSHRRYAAVYDANWAKHLKSKTAYEEVERNFENEAKWMKFKNNRPSAVVFRAILRGGVENLSLSDQEYMLTPENQDLVELIEKIIPTFDEKVAEKWKATEDQLKRAIKNNFNHEFSSVRIVEATPKQPVLQYDSKKDELLVTGGVADIILNERKNLARQNTVQVMMRHEIAHANGKKEVGAILDEFRIQLKGKNSLSIMTEIAAALGAVPSLLRFSLARQSVGKLGYATNLIFIPFGVLAAFWGLLKFGVVGNSLSKLFAPELISSFLLASTFGFQKFKESEFNRVINASDKLSPEEKSSALDLSAGTKVELLSNPLSAEENSIVLAFAEWNAEQGLIFSALKLLSGDSFGFELNSRFNDDPRFGEFWRGLRQKANEWMYKQDQEMIRLIKNEKFDEAASLTQENLKKTEGLYFDVIFLQQLIFIESHRVKVKKAATFARDAYLDEAVQRIKEIQDTYGFIPNLILQPTQRVLLSKSYVLNGSWNPMGAIKVLSPDGGMTLRSILRDHDRAKHHLMHGMLKLAKLEMNNKNFDEALAILNTAKMGTLRELADGTFLEPIEIMMLKAYFGRALDWNDRTQLPLIKSRLELLPKSNSKLRWVNRERVLLMAELNLELGRPFLALMDLGAADSGRVSRDQEVYLYAIKAAVKIGDWKTVSQLAESGAAAFPRTSIFSYWKREAIFNLKELNQGYKKNLIRSKEVFSQEEEGGADPSLEVKAHQGIKAGEILFDRWVKGTPLENEIRAINVTINQKNHLNGMIKFRSGGMRGFFIKSEGTTIKEVMSWSRGSGNGEWLLWGILKDLQARGFKTALFTIPYFDEGRRNHAFFFGNDEKPGIIKRWNRILSENDANASLLRVIKNDSDHEWVVEMPFGQFDMDLLRPSDGINNPGGEGHGPNPLMNPLLVLGVPSGLYGVESGEMTFLSSMLGISFLIMTLGMTYGYRVHTERKSTIGRLGYRPSGKMEFSNSDAVINFVLANEHIFKFLDLRVKTTITRRFKEEVPLSLSHPNGSRIKDIQKMISNAIGSWITELYSFEEIKEYIDDNKSKLSQEDQEGLVKLFEYYAGDAPPEKSSGRGKFIHITFKGYKSALGEFIRKISGEFDWNVAQMRFTKWVWDHQVASHDSKLKGNIKAEAWFTAVFEGFLIIAASSFNFGLYQYGMAPISITVLLQLFLFAVFLVNHDVDLSFDYIVPAFIFTLHTGIVYLLFIYGTAAIPPVGFMLPGVLLTHKLNDQKGFEARETFLAQTEMLSVDELRRAGLKGVVGFVLGPKFEGVESGSGSLADESWINLFMNFSGASPSEISRVLEDDEFIKGFAEIIRILSGDYFRNSSHGDTVSVNFLKSFRDILRSEDVDKIKTFIEKNRIGLSQFRHVEELQKDPNFISNRNPKEPGVIRILLADKPKSDAAIEAIRQLAATYDGRVEVIDEMGIGTDIPKLKRVIGENHPDIILLQSPTKAFNKPEERGLITFAKRFGLKAFVRAGAGVDNINLQEAKEAGVAVVPTYGADNSVAELGLRFLFADLLTENSQGVDISENVDYWEGILSISIGEYQAARRKAAERRKGEISDGAFAQIVPLVPTRSIVALAERLEGKTIGVVGFGHVAQAFIQKLNALKEKTNVQFSIAVTSRSLNDPTHPKHKDVMARAQDLGVIVPGETMVLRGSNFISLHAASTDETRGMINPHSIGSNLEAIINTARADLVDPAVFEKGSFRYYADVDFNDATEKLLAAYPDRVFLTPHIAASTKNAVEGVNANTLTELKRILDKLATQKDSKIQSDDNNPPTSQMGLLALMALGTPSGMWDDVGLPLVGVWMHGIMDLLTAMMPMIAPIFYLAVGNINSGRKWFSKHVSRKLHKVNMTLEFRDGYVYLTANDLEFRIKKSDWVLLGENPTLFERDAINIEEKQILSWSPLWNYENNFYREFVYYVFKYFYFAMMDSGDLDMDRNPIVPVPVFNLGVTYDPEEIQIELGPQEKFIISLKDENFNPLSGHPSNLNSHSRSNQNFIRFFAYIPLVLDSSRMKFEREFAANSFEVGSVLESLKAAVYFHAPWERTVTSDEPPIKPPLMGFLPLMFILPELQDSVASSGFIWMGALSWFAVLGIATISRATDSDKSKELKEKLKYFRIKMADRELVLKNLSANEKNLLPRDFFLLRARYEFLWDSKKIAEIYNQAPIEGTEIRPASVSQMVARAFSKFQKLVNPMDADALQVKEYLSLVPDFPAEQAKLLIEHYVKGIPMDVMAFRRGATLSNYSKAIKSIRRNLERTVFLQLIDIPEDHRTETNHMTHRQKLVVLLLDGVVLAIKEGDYKLAHHKLNFALEKMEEMPERESYLFESAFSTLLRIFARHVFPSRDPSYFYTFDSLTIDEFDLSDFIESAMKVPFEEPSPKSKSVVEASEENGKNKVDVPEKTLTLDSVSYPGSQAGFVIRHRNLLMHLEPEYFYILANLFLKRRTFQDISKDFGSNSPDLLEMRDRAMGALIQLVEDNRKVDFTSNISDVLQLISRLISVGDRYTAEKYLVSLKVFLNEKQSPEWDPTRKEVDRLSMEGNQEIPDPLTFGPLGSPLPDMSFLLAAAGLASSSSTFGGPINDLLFILIPIILFAAIQGSFSQRKYGEEYAREHRSQWENIHPKHQKILELLIDEQLSFAKAGKAVGISSTGAQFRYQQALNELKEVVSTGLPTDYQIFRENQDYMPFINKEYQRVLNWLYVEQKPLSDLAKILGRTAPAITSKVPHAIKELNDAADPKSDLGMVIRHRNLLPHLHPVFEFVLREYYLNHISLTDIGRYFERSNTYLSLIRSRAIVVLRDMVETTRVEMDASSIPESIELIEDLIKSGRWDDAEMALVRVKIYLNEFQNKELDPYRQKVADLTRYWERYADLPSTIAFPSTRADVGFFFGLAFMLDGGGLFGEISSVTALGLSLVLSGLLVGGILFLIIDWLSRPEKIDLERIRAFPNYLDIDSLKNGLDLIEVEPVATGDLNNETPRRLNLFVNRHFYDSVPLYAQTQIEDTLLAAESSPELIMLAKPIPFENEMVKAFLIKDLPTYLSNKGNELPIGFAHVIEQGNNRKASVFVILGKPLEKVELLESVYGFANPWTDLQKENRLETGRPFRYNFTNWNEKNYDLGRVHPYFGGYSSEEKAQIKNIITALVLNAFESVRERLHFPADISRESFQQAVLMDWIVDFDGGLIGRISHFGETQPGEIGFELERIIEAYRAPAALIEFDSSETIPAVDRFEDVARYLTKKQAQEYLSLQDVGKMFLLPGFMSVKNLGRFNNDMDLSFVGSFPGIKLDIRNERGWTAYYVKFPPKGSRNSLNQGLIPTQSPRPRPTRSFFSGENSWFWFGGFMPIFFMGDNHPGFLIASIIFGSIPLIGGAFLKQEHMYLVKENQDLLSRLPDEQRQVLELRILKKMTRREVADELGLTANKVSMAMTKGLRALYTLRNKREEIKNDKELIDGVVDKSPMGVLMSKINKFMEKGNYEEAENMISRAVDLMDHESIEIQEKYEKSLHELIQTVSARRFNKGRHSNPLFLFIGIAGLAPLAQGLLVGPLGFDVINKAIPSLGFLFLVAFLEFKNRNIYLATDGNANNSSVKPKSKTRQLIQNIDGQPMSLGVIHFSGATSDSEIRQEIRRLSQTEKPSYLILPPSGSANGRNVDPIVIRNVSVIYDSSPAYEMIRNDVNRNNFSDLDVYIDYSVHDQLADSRLAAYLSGLQNPKENESVNVRVRSYVMGRFGFLPFTFLVPIADLMGGLTNQIKVQLKALIAA